LVLSTHQRCQPTGDKQEVRTEEETLVQCLIHQYQTMKMRNLNLNQKHIQNQIEEELHNKEQEVKHLKEEGQETETQRISTSCINMQIQVEIGMIKDKRILMLMIITIMQPLIHQEQHIIKEMQVSSNQMLTNSSKMWINRCQTKVSNKSQLVNINQGYNGKGNIHTMLKH
jgi:hypothetical protein